MDAVQAPSDSSATAPVSSESVEDLWAAGPHAHTYVLTDQMMNSTCARCHAPTDYIPAIDDMPASCAACKFEIEPPPPMIEESGWRDIPCSVCHRIKKGKVDPKSAWLAVPPIDEYEDVATSTELCTKCHEPVDVAGHTGVVVAGAHNGYTCTQCHDAHSTTASCLSCHSDVSNSASSIPGHDAAHEAVSCWACHDAAGLTVGPDDQGNWLTFLPDVSLPSMSHNITKEATCERCHYANNPWSLTTDVEKE